RGRAREGLTLGAGTTLSAVAAHPEIVAHYGALATAAGLVSSPQLRNMGTLGGNVCVDTRCNYYNQSHEWRKAIGFCMKKDGDICLVAPGSSRCWAVSSSDTAPVLWSLGARVRLVGASGERVTPELIARVADLAAGPSKPLDNTDFTHPYRKKMTRVFVARALRALAGLPGGGRAGEEVA